MKLHVKSASFATDNGQTSRFSFSYRIFNNKNFFQNISTVLEEKSSCERFCKVPRAENHCWRKIGNGVISLLWQLRCHCSPDVVAIFPNVCLRRRSLCSDLALTLENCIEPPSFRLFLKNLGNLKDIFGQMVYRPPWQKISRTPMSTLNFEHHLQRWCKSLKLEKWTNF